jgi:hypothetical protein
MEVRRVQSYYEWNRKIFGTLRLLMLINGPEIRERQKEKENHAVGLRLPPAHESPAAELILLKAIVAAGFPQVGRGCSWQ